MEPGRNSDQKNTQPSAAPICSAAWPGMPQGAPRVTSSSAVLAAGSARRAAMSSRRARVWRGRMPGKRSLIGAQRLPRNVPGTA